MSVSEKRAPTVLLVLLLLGVAAHFLIKSRLDERIASESAQRRRELAVLRSENRQLLKQVAIAATNAASDNLPGRPSPEQRLNAAAELLKTGYFGPIAWTRGEDTSVQEEVANFADMVGLSSAQKADLQAAAAKAQVEIVAAVLAGAQVQLHENSIRGAPESPTEAAERNRLMPSLPPFEQVTTVANMLSKTTAARGDRELSIILPESPAARAAFEEMHANFARIMGPDTYAFYQAAGAARMIEGMFDEMGLQPHALSLVSRPTGTTSAAGESRLGNASATQPAQIYDVRRLRALATWQDPIKRSGGHRSVGGGTGSALEPIVQRTGVLSGGKTSLSLDALRVALGPLQSLIPPEF